MKLTNARLKKLSKLGAGGEADILDYSDDLALKIFKPSVDLLVKRQKVELLIASRLPPAVTAPLESVEVSGRFVGYSMKKLVGVDPVHQLAKKRYLAVTGLNNRDLLEIVAKVGQTISALHRAGLVIGDVSDYNIMVDASTREVYFIDTDSWGTGARLPPDVYTESFTAPEAYQSDGGVNLTDKTDLFALAVLGFAALTRQHPFEGTLKRSPNMSTTERIHRGISVLGSEDITIPHMIPSWRWLSPALTKLLREVFENGKRASIVDEVEDQLASSKLCPKCGVYYYGAYADCPVCDVGAKLAARPMAVKAVSGLPSIRVVFENADIRAIIAPDWYLARDGHGVHIKSGRRVAFPKGSNLAFSDDGGMAFIARGSEIQVIWDGGSVKLERAYRAPFIVRGDEVYLVEPSGTVSKVQVTPRGNIVSPLAHAYNPIFEVADRAFCVVSRYPQKAVANINGRNLEIQYTGKIRDYALKYDPASKHWLFVFKKPNGKWRTLILSGDKVEYDSDVLRFDASPLSNICFANSTIFDPGPRKITGTNPIKGTAKEFLCVVVDESSQLAFSRGVFTITSEQRIYQFG
ncbi:MAG: hypothetical protein LBL84_01425 [Candidatus Nomurabacteria bacterium]|jgi:hypothetical protein|nr:hypothetical protein [Candidatus Nomurabacteria bacterium]